jgi:hypothetical protein
MPPKRPMSGRGSMLRPASWRRNPKPTHTRFGGSAPAGPVAAPYRLQRQALEPRSNPSTPVVHSADLSVAASASDGSEQRRETRRASKGRYSFDKRAPYWRRAHASPGRHTSAPSARVPTTATADESGRKPAPGTERLWIVPSVAQQTLPHRDAHPGMRALREDDGPPTPPATQ